MPSKLIRSLTALGIAFAVAGCAQYATVSVTKPRFQPVRAGARALGSIDQSITKALRGGQREPLATVGEFLTAAHDASQQLARHPNDTAARDAYNFAVARVFSILRDKKIAMQGASLRAGDWELVGQTHLIDRATLAQVEFIPADQVKLSGTYVSQRSTKPGLGAPLIATLRDAEKLLKRDPFAQGKNIYYGVTAVARFEGHRCVISFEDPLAEETTTLGGRTYPLAADYTAPLALMLARENPKKLELARLLRPEKYAETARLARLQPYDPNKIPVICVHGLMDSPATWTPLLNAMRADPVIRSRYQFWFFSYPSGYPYPYSAALFRRQLDAIKLRHPGHKKIVLIGHSMGGCISRLMITDTGDQLWRDLFGKSPAETQLSPESRALFSDALIFKHRPDVGRVIFISAPLRGADMATNWTGRLGSMLVHTPAKLLHAGADVLKTVTFQADDLRLKRLPNSIDTLAPNNRFVKAIQKFPLAPGIPYNVICGDRGKGGSHDHTPPICSDGIVPYWSSHLDGAQSELIVHSHHSAHQNPQAIAEVERILKRHAP
jgi:pimeloyl-ACP methyl ester carboxylesterase